MVSISEIFTVQKKTKILPFLTRFGIGRTTTIKKSVESEDEVCLRRKTVQFGCSDNDDLPNKRPFSLPSIYNVQPKSTLEDCGNFEKSNDVERISSILKSSSITYNSHDLWVKEENRCIKYTKRDTSNQNKTLVISDYNSSTCSSASESTNSPFRRNSSIRQSLNNLWKKTKVKKANIESDANLNMNHTKHTAANIDIEINTSNNPTIIIETNDNDVPHKTTIHAKRNSVNDVFEKLNPTAKDVLGMKNVEKSHRRAHSYSGYTSADTKRSTNSVGLGFRPISSPPLESIKQDLHGQSVVDLNALSRSPSHISTKSDPKSLKQLSQSAPVAATNIRSSSPHPLKVSKHDSTEKPDKPEKEKKKKELSRSRQKKFARHFQQVSPDEKVLNYFSCALVSDILLQGHLYITQNYFAFYSNVFGYVTKILIPTISVIKISKEKTAKIIPNAVGVTTCDERHVFGSFMSREAAYRLMLSVWRPVAPPEIEEPITPKIPDVEISECSVEDESSCSASGNESSSQVKDKKSDIVESGDSIEKLIIPSVTDSAKLLFDGNYSTVQSSINHFKHVNPSAILTSATIIKASTNPPSQSSIYKEKTNNNNKKSSSRFQLIFPSDFRVIHLGVFLAVILAFFSCFLMYKIHYLQSRTNSFHPNDFRWGSDKNMDVYAEVLKWQKQMQAKSTEEAQIVLNSNLEQIAKVRKSLETLSILLHDTSMKYAAGATGSESNLDDSLDDAIMFEGAT